MNLKLSRGSFIVGLAGIVSLSNAQLSFDDEKVVSASMATLFVPSEWTSPSWNRGDVVLVDPKWHSRGRTSFREAVDRFGHFTRDAKDRKVFQELRKAENEPNSWLRREPSDLKTMMLGPRVVVGEMQPEHERSYGWFPGRHRVLGGKSGFTVRVPFALEAPGYSPSGQYAVVMGRAPWSIHDADIFFFLKRSGANWAVTRVNPEFHV